MPLAHACAPGLPAQVKSGVVYEGIFHTADLDSKDVSIVLKMARTVVDPAAEEGAWAPQKPVPSLVVYATDLVQVMATDVRMGAADVGPVGSDDAGGFGTDAAISRGRGGCAGGAGLRWRPRACRGAGGEGRLCCGGSALQAGERERALRPAARPA